MSNFIGNDFNVDFEFFDEDSGNDLYLPQTTQNSAVPGVPLNSVYVPAYREKPVATVSGEVLLADFGGNTMRAKKETERRHTFRPVCSGVICGGKKIQYLQDGQIKEFYIIKTVDIYGNKKSLIVYAEDFESSRLVNVLARQGGLAFLAHKSKAIEAELLQNYIMAVSESTDVIYPEKPSWVEGKYMYVAESYNIDTPFFRNTINVPCTQLGAKETFENLLSVLCVFKNMYHRIAFIILYHYIVLQGLIPAELRFDKAISINACDEVLKIFRNIFAVFNRGEQKSISLTQNPRVLEQEIKMCEGGAIFFVNTENTANRYFQEKSKNNAAYIARNASGSLIQFVLNSNFEGYIPDMFNISINDNEVDRSAYLKALNKIPYLTEHLLYFVTWISDMGYYKPESINERIEKLSGTESDSKSILLKIIYDLICEYARMQNLRFDDDVSEALEEICNKSNGTFVGEWVVARFSQIYRELIVKGDCQRIKLIHGNSEIFDFCDDKPTFIEKDELLYIREEDLKWIVKRFPSSMTVNRLKKSLALADALETDIGEAYRKNLFIPCKNTAKRMLAIKKSALEYAGSIKI